MWLSVLLLCSGITTALAQCEPGFADSCFGAVQSDLKYMLKLPEGLAKNISFAAVEELCLGLDDALNCTADVIDFDCKDVDGRQFFDAWLTALRAAYNYACGSQHEKLTDILRSIPCWNVDEFLRCTKSRADLGHVRELLHTDLDAEECRDLWDTFHECYNQAEVGSCREQESIKDEFQELTSAFFNASYCREVVKIPSVQGRLPAHSEPVTDCASSVTTLLVLPLSATFLFTPFTRTFD